MFATALQFVTIQVIKSCWFIDLVAQKKMLLSQSYVKYYKIIIATFPLYSCSLVCSLFNSLEVEV